MNHDLMKLFEYSMSMSFWSKTKSQVSVLRTNAILVCRLDSCDEKSVHGELKCVRVRIKYLLFRRHALYN